MCTPSSSGRVSGSGGTAVVVGWFGAGQPAAVASTSSVCSPTVGAGARTEPGVSENFDRRARPAPRGPSTGSSTVTTISLWRACGVSYTSVGRRCSTTHTSASRNRCTHSARGRVLKMSTSSNWRIGICSSVSGTPMSMPSALGGTRSSMPSTHIARPNAPTAPVCRPRYSPSPHSNERVTSRVLAVDWNESGASRDAIDASLSPHIMEWYARAPSSSEVWTWRP